MSRNDTNSPSEPFFEDESAIPTPEDKGADAAGPLFGRIEVALSMLTPLEQTVLKALYGLGYGQRATISSLAEELGITEAAVREIEKDCYRHLRFHPELMQ